MQELPGKQDADLTWGRGFLNRCRYLWSRNSPKRLLLTSADTTDAIRCRPKCGLVNRSADWLRGFGRDNSARWRLSVQSSPNSGPRSPEDRVEAISLRASGRCNRQYEEIVVRAGGVSHECRLDSLNRTLLRLPSRGSCLASN